MPHTADVIVANRAYLDHNTPPGDAGPPPTGGGGLLVAVSPTIARDGSTTWIGAGRGSHDREWTDAGGREELQLPGGGILAHQRLFFDDDRWTAHYATTTPTASPWPFLHLVRLPFPELTSYFPAPETPSEGDWAHFEAANAAFADAAADAGRGETCWIHDYQLGLAPALVRERGYRGAIGFFLHTPCPSLAVARDFLDERGFEYIRSWVRGILGSDLAGFQTPADVERFRDLATGLGLAEAEGEALRVDGRLVRVGAFPVGIDFEDTMAIAAPGQLPALLEAQDGFARPLVIGLERADYTKGVPERLRTIAELYRQGHVFSYVGLASADARGRTGVRSPPRRDGRGRPGVPGSSAGSRALFGSTTQAVPFDEVMGLMGAADVVCTSSLSDGMNLVPLQAVAAHAGRPRDSRAVALDGHATRASPSAFAGFEDATASCRWTRSTPATSRAFCATRSKGSLRPSAIGWSRRYAPPMPADGANATSPRWRMPMLDTDATARLSEIAHSRGPLLVATDLDGTLAPIVLDPADAHVPGAALAVLDRLSSVVRVAVVTGRDLNTARRMVPCEGVTIVGSHGLEPSFDSPLLPGVDRIKLAPALEQVEQQVLSKVPGAYLHIERKAISTAFHFRQAQHLEQPLRSALADLPDTLRIREGRMVLEVMPNAQGGKDIALTALANHFKARSIVVMGDDRTDVGMFEAAIAERANDRTVLVCGVTGGEETPPGIVENADLMLESPEAAREALEILSRALGA
ncbi:MAG: trehalose-phosphatase [Dehalococcoidia bacterium]|nr:trehalose-phosphatase [Dehalococcoidia bacterium]